MRNKNAYQIIKKRLISEKATILEGLKDSKSNKQISKFKKAKYVFLVDTKADKKEIKKALEEIYKDKKIVIEDVNTIVTKPRRKVFRGMVGKTKWKKKAIVTLREGDKIEEKKG